MSATAWTPADESELKSQWQRVDEAPKTVARPAQKVGFISRASEALGLTQHPIDQLKSEVSQFAKHPIDTTIQAGKQAIVGLRDTANNLSPVKFDDQGGAHLNNPLTAARDMVGGQRFAEDIENKDYGGAAGTIVGNAIPILTGAATKARVPIEETNAGFAKSAIQKPEIVRPTDVPARKLAKAINPPVNDWNEFIRANQQQAGNIRNFAMRNKLPIDTQLDWSKAARAYAEDANKGFQGIFDPLANEQVYVGGSGYRGAAIGEGQRATLGAVAKRIRDINAELSTNYEKRTSGQVRAALATDAELVAEKESLTNLLHDEVARRTGMTPEQVGELRRPGAQAFSIADNTTAAMNQRESSAGKIIEGRRDVPQTMPGIIAEGYNRIVRGGPEKIADKQFRKAMRSGTVFPVDERPTPRK